MEDVIIMKSGKEIARLISYNKGVSFLSDSLVGMLKNDYDDKTMKEEKLKKYENFDWYKCDLRCIMNRRLYMEDSLNIMRLCEAKMIVGCVSALSIVNIIYIMRKELNHEDIKLFINKIGHILEIVDLKTNDLMMACMQEFNDYEDAIQSVQANRINADFIVTRNIKDFAKSKVFTLEPKEFFEQMHNIVEA